MKKYPDLNIFQYGGCGAGYFHQQLLIAGDYHSNFMYNKNPAEVRKYAYKAPGKKSWKDRDISPDNDATLRFVTDKPKIFREVNSYNYWYDLPGEKIVIYTDLRTQIRMNYWKKSFWFHKRFMNYHVDETYSGIKKLIADNPNNIYHEYETRNLLQYKTVYFQDILTIGGLESMLNDFGHEINQENIDFLKNYLLVHPPKLLEKCKIKKIS
jgi:hypothetical protein